MLYVYLFGLMAVHGIFLFSEQSCILFLVSVRERCSGQTNFQLS